MKLRYVGLGASMLVSLAAVAVVGNIQKDRILRPLELDEGVDPVKVPFLLVSDGDLKSQIELARENLDRGNSPNGGDDLPANTVPPATAPPATTAPPETAPPATTAPPETAPPATTAPPETAPPATTAPPETTVPADVPPENDGNHVTAGAGGVFVPGNMVDESWFDDALFIGDSRTDGLRLYARLGKADYFCSTGLSVYTVLTKSCSDRNFSSQKLETLLSGRTYGKILIGLGINECGSNLKSYVKAYQKLIDVVRAKQPGAVVILQAIMTCSPKKERQNAVFGPENIYKRNEAIRGLADGRTIFYIDVNEVFADENGYLPADFSGDGCHLYAKKYPLWVEWIRSAVYDIPPAGSPGPEPPAGETLPPETQAEETIPPETLPEETVPPETIPEETTSSDTQPTKTVPP